ncbi:MAG: cell division protein FtsW [Clostridia bacterium]|nr:cell division protein FtsW [Clostridia bacterium]
MEKVISLRSEKRRTNRAFGGVDVPLLVIASALVLFGCVMVYSASSVYAEQYHGDRSYFIVRHLVFLLLAVGITALALRFATPRFWSDFGVALYGASIVMLLLVLVIGSDLGSGAKRWLDFGIFTVQPSEVAKLALVLTLSRYMVDHRDRISDKGRGSFRYGVLYPVLMIGGLLVLVALEKHISGIMIIGMLGITVMYLGGTKPVWIFSIVGFIALAGVLLIVLFPYAQARVDTWLRIEEADPLGSAWQTLQGLMAIGSGGLFGRGLGMSRQKYGYVSQPQNDFIFTIVCEELGFFGAFLVLALFALYVARGFYIAKHASDTTSSLIIFGLTFKVALQVIMNVAVVTNSMPNTGISLPFFSYGGTSLMLQIFEVGIVLSLSRFANNQKI